MTGLLGLFERGDEVSERRVVHASSVLRGGDGEADREGVIADVARATCDAVKVLTRE
jgi:hypothetical protein